jgi:hypothetical protein
MKLGEDLMRVPLRVGAGTSGRMGEGLPEPPSALSYLQGIYRDPLQTDAVRMRAAIAALPFEHPKLAVTANFGMDKESFAAQMKEIAERSGRSNVIDGADALARRAQMIEAKPTPQLDDEGKLPPTFKRKI